MTDTRTISQTLAQFVQGVDTDRLPARIVELAKIRLLDSLSTALAARGLHVPGTVLAIVGQNSGPATVIGQRRTLPPIDAAFANATLVNGRSQDDFMQKSHPGALTVPAVLAIAEQCARSGAEVLAGIVAGYEIVGRMYLGAPGMLPRFRASGVAGTVGAAAAAARMLRLDAAQTANALGCAALFAHGFGEGFFSGTNEVKLNVGMASRNGVTAALLAQAGATASPTAFEGEAGYLRAFDGSLAHAAEMIRDLGSRYLIEETVYKECPVCIFTQTPIVLARTLAPKFDAASVERVVVTSPELTHTNPGFINEGPYDTHLQAVVSARFCTAAALLGRPVEDYDYYDNVGDPEVIALGKKIELRMRTTDSDRVDIEVMQGNGVLRASGIETETLFPTADKVIAKFGRITQHLPWLERDRIVETVLALDRLPEIGALTALLKGPAD